MTPYGIVAFAAALLTIAASAPLREVRAQGATTVAAPAAGKTAFEFLGRSDQDGPALTHYGYLTHVAGLDDAQLFSDPAARGEATARLTYSATTSLNARHELGNLIVTAAPGTMTVFLNEEGADFNDPQSFSRGTPIATFEVRYHNVLTVQQPNSGTASAVADLAQLTAGTFTLGGGNLRFGRAGLPAQIAASGQGTRTQEEPLRSFFLIGGKATVAGKRAAR